MQNSKLEGFLKSVKDKKVQKADILKVGFRNPEVLLTILTLFYMILMFVVPAVESSLPELRHIIVAGAELPYWGCGLLTVLMALSLYAALALARILIRTATRADIYGAEVQSCLARN